MENDYGRTRRALLTGAGAAGLALVSHRHAGAQDEGEVSGDFSAIHKLNLIRPANINGPFPKNSLAANVGDLIELQIGYPIAPPFPNSAKIDVDPKIFIPVGVYKTRGEVAILTTEQQRGRIGLGYLSALAKAKAEGKGDFKVQVKMSDGTIKVVMLKFNITRAKE